MKINALESVDEGPWECVAFEGRNEASKFVVIRVTEKSEKLQLLLDQDETELNVRIGDDVSLFYVLLHITTSSFSK